jgi:tRNA-splicing ligase RtcB
MHSKQSRAIRGTMNIDRIYKSLLKDGLSVGKEGHFYTIKQINHDTAPVSKILLPEGFPLERKAVNQLAAFASAHHPSGGKVLAAFATPDFHPGDIVPVGAVIATTLDMVIPQAVGTDIQCGMRLHVADIGVDEFLSRESEIIDLLTGDLLLGTRNLPMTSRIFRSIFESGCIGWYEDMSRNPMGCLENSDFDQIYLELDQIYGFGSYDGSVLDAPNNLLDYTRPIIRDAGIGTIGGGNHFIEIQVVEEILDKYNAYKFGIKLGQIAIMIHSGSRLVGIHIGNTWMEYAKNKWPKGIKHPLNNIYPLYGEDADQYILAMNAAANYASVNRLLLAEMVRLRFREIFGHREIPLVFDVPHNIVLKEYDKYIHRKGATPAHEGQPVLIPGSMGHPSYLLVGLGNKEYLSSASHGAGRKLTRYEMRSKNESELGLENVKCITLKKERLVQEAPAAYKPIQPVVDIQADVGIVRPVAKMKPILTFKA